jgi:hypothetical protein
LGTPAVLLICVTPPYGPPGPTGPGLKAGPFNVLVPSFVLYAELTEDIELYDFVI